MDINETINLIKKIDSQNNNYLNQYNESVYTSHKTLIPKKTPYALLVKEALYDNFIESANLLKLGNKAKTTGVNFIESIANNCSDEISELHYTKLRPKYNNEESVIEYTYAMLIDEAAQELNAISFQLSNINEESSATLGHKGVIDKFHDNISKFTPSKIQKAIADRVEKATSSFIANRSKKLDKIKDIYEKAKSFVANPKFSDEAKKRVNESANRQVLEIRKEEKTLFESMVEALANNTMTNSDLQSRYVNESGLNMDAIIDDTAAIYTVLEECNVFGLLDANKLANQYIDSLNKK
jgi:hypothetical protein